MLKETQIKNIETVLNEIRSELNDSMLKSAHKSDTQAVNETMKDISVINSISAMFIRPRKATAKKASAAKTGKTTNKTEKTGGKASKNTYRLGDDMKGKRPQEVIINGDKYEVSSFRDMTKVICESAFSLNPTAFVNLANVEDVNGGEHVYFAKKKTDKMEEPTEIKAKSGETFYIDAGRLSINNMLFLRKALKILGIDEKNIKIKVDPNYTRKPRTAAASAAANA